MMTTLFFYKFSVNVNDIVILLMHQYDKNTSPVSHQVNAIVCKHCSLMWYKRLTSNKL